jgi:uncharacterized protein (DUF2126 family)
LVDRLLRHLLTDLTGNAPVRSFPSTSSIRPTGRLTPGPVEFRAFNAAALPDERAADGAAARVGGAFLARAYGGQLVHWGTVLHDRWLLPHFVAADIRDVAVD